METNNAVVNALEEAKLFLDKVLKEDEFIIDFVNRPDVKLTIALLEKKFPALEKGISEIDKVSGYVKNIAKNAQAIIDDLLDIVKIASNPLV
jgi:transcription antitermination factor NusA-like protein